MHQETLGYPSDPVERFPDNFLSSLLALQTIGVKTDPETGEPVFAADAQKLERARKAAAEFGAEDMLDSAEKLWKESSVRPVLERIAGRAKR